MWKLKKLKEDAWIYLVTEKGSYVVGRKNCEIEFQNDTSISRKHCTLYIAKKNDCRFPVKTSTGIWIVDENSKYGTFIRYGENWKKLNKGEEINLSNGTIIRFGILDNVWSVEYAPVIACTSGLQTIEKKSINDNLMSINGELRNEWSKECTLTIVNDITLTVKVVLALINGTPIVTQAYLKKLIECVQNHLPPPDFKDYRPDIKETVLNTSLVSLDPNTTRKNLFKGLLFIFPTKQQFEILKEVVVNASGKTELLNFDIEWNRLQDKNIVLIQLPVNKSNISKELIDKFEQIAEYLKNKFNKRVVPESEIAQAIAYSSIEKYCNTMHKNCPEIPIKMEIDMGHVLVEDTPDVKQFISEPCVVPCTLNDKEYDDLLPAITGSQTHGQKRNISPDQWVHQIKFRRSEKGARESTSRSEENTQKSTHNIKNKGGIEFDRSDLEKCAERNLFECDLSKEQRGESSKNSAINKNRGQSSARTTFQDQNVETIENASKFDTNQHKRKLSKSNQTGVESSKAKKIKLPTEKEKTDNNLESRQQISISEFPDMSSVSESLPNDPNHQTEDFVEKDRTEIVSSCGMSDYNNVVYSINLVSSNYLNHDGSLIEPPDVPVNVKKFKKQRIATNKECISNNVDDDVGWLEAHPSTD